ncbi:hypothetical protein [Streptomyces ipomoeae]|uniref:hypothetical protein n=1 Tax=Streptomyces ipomoeae TaxID=103232 RepID=UPI00215D3202|nr:hypothetical protein [Streptomyces ipomoeae]
MSALLTPALKSEAGPAVRDLSSSERIVALYASDMPAQGGIGTPGQVRAWIAQGAVRLGGAELRRRAEFHHGFFLLELDGLVTAAVLARHEQCFPDVSRLEAADEAAALSVRVDGMSEAGRARNAAAQVKGCPCGGTGTIAVDDFDPDLSYAVYCPVHAPAASLHFRAGH